MINSRNMASWIVLQKQYSEYEDEEGISYKYPLSIPNGRQIKPGDYLICTLTSREAVNKKRIFGIGRVSDIEESGNGRATASYGWYKEFEEPYTFDEIGGDPRNNGTNSINRVPDEREGQILGLLIEEASADIGVRIEEQRLNSLFKHVREHTPLEWDESLAEAVKQIFASIFRSQNALKALVPEFGWKGLGNMLGDFGEFMALHNLELVKAPTGTKDYDAVTKDGKTVQIKTSYVGGTVALRGTADFLLVVKVHLDGEWKIIYFGDYDRVKMAASYGARDNKHAITIKKLMSLAPKANGTIQGSAGNT